MYIRLNVCIVQRGINAVSTLFNYTYNVFIASASEMHHQTAMGAEHNQRKPFEVNEANFEAEVLRSPYPTLVAFGAPWSKPCESVEFSLNEVAVLCPGKLRVLRVNVDNNPDLSAWYGIDSIPTLLWFVEGAVRARIVGTVSAQAILAKLEPLPPDLIKLPAAEQPPNLKPRIETT
jgi:thioredoxin 1